MPYPAKYRVQVRELAEEFCNFYETNPDLAIEMLTEAIDDKPQIFIRQVLSKIQIIYPEFKL